MDFSNPGVLVGIATFLSLWAGFILGALYGSSKKKEKIAAVDGATFPVADEPTGPKVELITGVNETPKDPDLNIIDVYFNKHESYGQCYLAINNVVMLRDNTWTSHLVRDGVVAFLLAAKDKTTDRRIDKYLEAIGTTKVNTVKEFEGVRFEFRFHPGKLPPSDYT